nr:MAG TPA: DNA-directed RNA polymerase subunit alpha [Caudoviricetes sp.]
MGSFHPLACIVALGCAMLVHVTARVTPELKGPRPMPRTHGLRSTYVAGCRCDQCRAANREYGRKKSRITDLTPAHREAQRAAQEASVEAATRSHRPWEQWEDEVAGDYSRSISEIAADLGRTVSSVRNRRAVKGLRAKWHAAHVLEGGEQE